MRLRRGFLVTTGAVLALVGGLSCTPGERPAGSGASPTPDPTAGSGSDVQEQYPGGNPLVAGTEAGQVRGLQGAGIRAWAGVPYAAPPVDDLRWRPPEPPEPWDGVRDAAQPGSPCVQPAGATVQGSEDCLYLNVYRPDDDTAGLPVLVYMHGGGLRVGSNLFLPQHVSPLVSQGVVLVSINYRLGRMGYFAHPALAAEQKRDGRERTANFGLLDQVAALEWVRDNIAGFGGDPGRVTIQGLSAGGASVNYLMASQRARGLFHGAIAQSGLGGEQPRPWAQALRDGTAVTDRIDAPADSSEDLRNLSAEDVVGAGEGPFIGTHVPVRDSVLPAPVAEVFARGNEAAVPYLSGTTDGEFRDENYVAVGISPEARRVRVLDGERRAAVAAYGSGDAVERQLLDDVLFQQPARLLTREHASQAPSYRYRFSITAPDADPAEGAPHASDRLFPFGFGNPRVPEGTSLATRISECFATFVINGAPDCGLDWPEAETGGLVEFTNDGPKVHKVDPWRDRLDVVADLVS